MLLNGAGKASGIFSFLEKHVVCVEFLDNFRSVLFRVVQHGGPFCENDIHLKCYVCFWENLYFLWFKRMSGEVWRN